MTWTISEMFNFLILI